MGIGPTVGDHGWGFGAADPKLRAGSLFPSLLERRWRVDQALFAVVMEVYLHGVRTRKVDDLVRALGADSGISKSEVSRICAHLDQEVSAFRDRSLTGQTFPYVFVDATYGKARFHFLGNILAQVPKGSAEMVAVAIRAIFAQPGASHVHDQLDVIAGMLGRQFPKLETMLRDNAESAREVAA